MAKIRTKSYVGNYWIPILLTIPIITIPIACIYIISQIVEVEEDCDNPEDYLKFRFKKAN